MIFTKIVTFPRKLRERITENYINKNIVNKNGLNHFFWQPVLFPLFKITLITILFFVLLPYHKFLGDFFKSVFDFFKLDEIFNFKFPEIDFFYRISKALFILVFGYYGVQFLYKQIESIFSTMIIDEIAKKLIYIKNYIIIKNVMVFSLKEVELVTLKQNIVGRFFNFGTIVLQRKNGDEIYIRTMGRIRMAIKKINSCLDDRKRIIGSR